MKRYQYVVAATCLLLSAMGFVGLYATNKAEEKEEQVKNQQIVEDSEEIILGSDLFDTEDEQNQVAGIDENVNLEKPDEEIKSDDDEQQEIAEQVPIEMKLQLERLHRKLCILIQKME